MDWHYTLQLNEASSRMEGFDACLEIARPLGYEVCTQPDGSVLTFAQSGEEHRIPSQVKLYEWVAETDTLFALTKKGADRYPTVVVGSRTLHLCSSGGLRTGDVEYGAELQSMLLRLAERLKPNYGYSADEWSLEFGWRGEFEAAWGRYQEAVEKKTAPEILWWLNYFGEDYFRDIAPRLSTDPSISTTKGESGVVVRLSHEPWSTRLARLEADGKYHTAIEVQSVR